MPQFLSRTVPALSLARLRLLLLLFLLWGAAPAARADCPIEARELPLAGGAILHYSQTGEDPPVVLLHGLFASKEQWHGLMCHLAAAGHQVLAPDLPGYGASRGFPRQDYALPRQVERLHEFITGLELPPLALAGNSMGGAVTGLYARQHPRQVSSLALLAPMGLGDWSPRFKQLLSQGNPLIPLSIDAFDRELALLMARPPQLPRAYKARVVAGYQSELSHYRQVWAQVHRDRVDYCASGGPPTLVLWGSQEQLFARPPEPAVSRCLPGSRQVLLPGVGHLPQLEAPQATAAAYLDFLSRTEAP